MKNFFNSFFSSLVIATSLNAGTVQFNTQDGSITVNSGSSSTFDALPNFTFTVNTDGEAVFQFPGDLIIEDDALVFIGSRFPQIYATGNLTIRNTDVNVSAFLITSGPGGGTGGNGGNGGGPATGGTSFPDGGDGAPGGATSFTRGVTGESGQMGTNGRVGFNGSNGSSGRNSSGPGNGGSPGGGGAGGVGFAGGLGGNTSTQIFTNGEDGEDGRQGGNGNTGRSGNTGTGGTNTGTGILPSAGSGGGGGGGAGGGGKGGSGSGGGGGGAGTFTASFPSPFVAGGDAGRGGNGGSAGTGGRGGKGGAGGGAITLKAGGILSLDSVNARARGGNGSFGSQGENGTAGFVGLTGSFGDSSSPNGTTVRGGRGGRGARGGRGGSGGTGGRGGGGAGGAIRLIATIIEYGQAVQIDTPGGNGAGSGRLITLAHGVNGQPSSIIASVSSFSGEVIENSLIVGNITTPTLASTSNTAEPFGILANANLSSTPYSDFFAPAPSDSIIGIRRVTDETPIFGADVSGYDLILISNLDSAPITNLSLGIDPGDSNGAFLIPISNGIDTTNRIFATFVPEDGTSLNIASNQTNRSLIDLQDDRTFFLNASGELFSQTPDSPLLSLVSTSETEITISWNIAGANNLTFQIFRSVNEGVETQIATTSSTSYVDNDVREGNLYRYKVVAVNSLNQLSDSNQATTVATPISSDIEQLASIDNLFPSQSVTGAFDVLLADDFTVAPGEIWYPYRFSFFGSQSSSTLPLVSLVIYEDDNGVPSTPVFSKNGVQPSGFTDGTGGIDIYTLILLPSERPALPEGKYWVSFFTNEPLFNQTFAWNSYLTNTISGNDALFFDGTQNTWERPFSSSYDVVMAISFIEMNVFEPVFSIQTIEQSGTLLYLPTLRWPSEPGFVYAVESAATLGDSINNPFSEEPNSEQVGTGSVLQWDGNAVSERSRFYRVIVKE